MKRRTLLSAILGSFLALGLPVRGQKAPVPIVVAAAGDLRGALEDVQKVFEARRPDVRLQLSFGASGALTAMIQQGAPFDVFLSADMGFPEQLGKAGLGGAIHPYATGSLTLWVRRDLGLDPAKEGLTVLRHPSIRKIATANPLTAPYGRAGEAALRGAGLLDAVRSRLVFGDNIAQAAQFLQAGTAEAGLVSRSQALNPALTATGVAWTVPADLHPPLRQGGIVLGRTAHPGEAAAFMAFLTGPEGQAVLARHGFGRP